MLSVIGYYGAFIEVAGSGNSSENVNCGPFMAGKSPKECAVEYLEQYEMYFFVVGFWQNVELSTE